MEKEKSLPLAIEFFAWGHMYTGYLEVGNYSYGEGIAVELWFESEDGLEPYASLTVNLPNPCCNGNRAYVDTNNFPEAIGLLEKYRLAAPTGRMGFSGFCVYPEYEFDLEEIEKYRIFPYDEETEAAV